MHQPRVIATPGHNFFHPVFLAKVPLADKLDLQAGFGRQPLGVLPQLIPERLGETRIVEDPHPTLVQV